MLMGLSIVLSRLMGCEFILLSLEKVALLGCLFFFFMVGCSIGICGEG